LSSAYSWIYSGGWADYFKLFEPKVGFERLKFKLLKLSDE